MIATTLYHGSNTAVPQPEIRVGRYAKDFGPGFYCTELKIQAQRWASRFDTAVVSSYTFISTDTLNILNFSQMTEDWLDFIVACRNHKVHDYDVVIGAMANDQVYNYIADYLSGILTREQFWILAKFKHPTHQVAFCTERAIKNLAFLGSEEVHP